MIESIVAKCFTLINYPMAIAGSKGLEAVTHIKERRHVAKILTIVFRDFPQIMRSTNLEYTLQFVWKLSI
jgi:hypothetical protein